MFSLINDDIAAYCEAHSTAESALLYELNRETHLRTTHPRMLSGHLQGRLLALISTLKKPRHILEIGTFTGYATLCLAEGLADDGVIDTIEIDVEMEERIRHYFARSPRAAQLQLHIGDAMTIIPTLDKPWDLVFVDAEKEKYLDYYQLVLPQMRAGGLILVDNVLWNEKVVQAEAQRDAETRRMMAFNDFVQRDARVKNLLLPLRDGLLIIEKI